VVVAAVDEVVSGDDTVGGGPSVVDVVVLPAELVVTEEAGAAVDDVAALLLVTAPVVEVVEPIVVVEEGPAPPAVGVAAGATAGAPSSSSGPSRGPTGTRSWARTSRTSPAITSRRACRSASDRLAPSSSLSSFLISVSRFCPSWLNLTGPPVVTMNWYAAANVSHRVQFWLMAMATFSGVTTLGSPVMRRIWNEMATVRQSVQLATATAAFPLSTTSPAMRRTWKAKSKRLDPSFVLMAIAVVS
jgi:hypothetical protein